MVRFLLFEGGEPFANKENSVLASVDRSRPVLRSLVALLLSLWWTGPLAATTIRGQVVDAAGEPLVGVEAQVRAMASRFAVLTREASSPVLARALSNADGVYTLELPEVGVFEVQLSSDGYLPQVFSPLPIVGETRGLPPATLHPLADQPARVRVLQAGGTSLAGACVWVEPAVGAGGWRAVSRRAQTDDQGRATAPRAVGETLGWVAAAPGIPRLGRGRGQDAAQVTVGGPAVDQVLRWVDSEDRALPGVVLALPGSPCPLALGDSEGAAGLALPVGRRVSVEVWVGGALVATHELDGSASRQGSETATIQTVPIQTTPIERVRIETGSRWAGRVLTADGRPLAEVLIFATDDGGSWTVSDAQGRWGLDRPMAPGTPLRLVAQGFLPQQVELAKGRQQAPVISRLEAASILSGTVAGGDGQTVPGVAIEARPLSVDGGSETRLVSDIRWAFTDGSGRFSLPQLEARQDHRVLASHRSFAPAEQVTPPRPDLALELAPRRPGFGQVLDGEEQPIVGARVVVIHQGRPSPVLETDDRGRFELDHLASGSVDLMAHSPRHAELLVRGIEVGAGSDPVDLGTLVLADGLELVGRVVGSEDEGLEGVWVEIADRRGSRRQAKSGDEGEFRFAGLGEGPWDLQASSELHAVEFVSGIRLPIATPLTLRLERSSTLHGLVVGEEGQPVVGARVEIEPWRREGRLEPRGRGLARTTTSDEVGAFRVSGLHAGRYRVRGSGEGYRPSDWQLLEVEAERQNDLEIPLQVGWTLEGRLGTDLGDPLPGRRLQLGEVQAITDSEGRFELTDLAPGPGRLELRDPRTRRRSWPVDVVPGMEPLELVVPAGQELLGNVETAGGLAVEGAEVQLTRPDGGGRMVARTTSDSEGRFGIDGLGDGRYRLVARHPDHGPGWLEVVLEPTAATPEARLVLQPTTTLLGFLTGLPDEDRGLATVRAEHPELGDATGEVDYQGRYRIEGLAPGAWRVQAETSDGRRQAAAHLRLQGEPERHQDLHFEGLAVHGSVLLAGESLAAARITLRSPQRSTERRTRTDLAGAFVLGDVPAGRYWLDVVAPRRSLTHVERVELYEDRELAIDLAPGTLAGEVTDPDGEPVARARLRFAQRMRDGSEGPVLMFGSDGVGQFRVENAMPGSYRLTVRHPGHQTGELDFELGSGDSEWLEVQLSAASVLALRPWIRDRTLDAVTVSQLTAAGEVVRTTGLPLDDTGTATFDTLPEGDLDLLVSAPGAAARRIRARVPGPEVEVELDPASRINVSVPRLAETEVLAWAQVLTTEGQPLSFFDSMARYRDRWSVTHGRATVGELPAGEWILRVETSEGAFWQAPVTTSVGGHTPWVFDGAPRGGAVP